MRNLVFLVKLVNLFEARTDIFADECGEKIEDWVRYYEIYYGDSIQGSFFFVFFEKSIQAS